MTRDEAKKALAETGRFSCVGELVALREVELIEAVYAHEAVSSAGPSSPREYAQAQLLRAS